MIAAVRWSLATNRFAFNKFKPPPILAFNLWSYALNSLFNLVALPNEVKNFSFSYLLPLRRVNGKIRALNGTKNRRR